MTPPREIGTAFQRSLGLRWSAADAAGAVAVEMDVRKDLCGPAGSVEGGVVSTLVDVAGASAAAFACGSLVATQTLSISFLAPGRSGPLVATGVPVRVGETDAVSEVHVIDKGRDDRLIAVGLVTLRILRDFTLDKVPGAL